MSFDPLAAYKNMSTNPESKKRYNEFWDRFQKNKKECPIDPSDETGCDSCQ